MMPFLQQVHFTSRDPGLVWKKDSFVTLKPDSLLDDFWTLTPNTVKMPAGGYRLYYTGVSRERRAQNSLGYILSAVSADGIYWQKEAGIRLDNFSGGGEVWVYCPDVVPLPNGGWRMYFQAKTFEGFDKIFSAISSDGLSWQLEAGTRFSDHFHDCGSPRCLPLEDGRWRLYFHFRNDAEHHIMSAISADGLHFQMEADPRITRERPCESHTVYAPEVLRLGTGGYRMYYAGWSESPRQGRILSAFSEDGLLWKKDDHICVDVGGAGQELKVSEPCVIELADGSFRLYYEACDDQGQWRIFAATAVSG